jgi:sarcosine oxidase, subunit alpha
MMRLPTLAGEWIDRTRTVTFTFESEPVTGYEGDTISTALAAGGARVFGRSFKYHRPRGFLSFANHDVNVMTQVESVGRSIPNVRGDVEAPIAHSKITAVNTRGGLKNDRYAFLNHLSTFLPVGFYYKAFHSKRLFPTWERLFRRITGLGRVDLEASHRSTPKRYDFCDVLVIGAGPSGLSAALAAASAGADVLLVDENRALGGSGLYARAGTESVLAKTEALVRAVLAEPRIRVLLSSFASGYYADHWVSVIAPEAMVKVRARSVVIAQGAYEQPCVFRGNDLPGVMLASAAQRLLYRFSVAPARRIAVLTANAEGYAAALDAKSRGLDVATVLDLRATPGPDSADLMVQLSQQGIRLIIDVKPIEAVAGRDGSVARLRYSAGGIEAAIAVDGVWMSVGFAPASAFLHQAGATMRYESSIEQFVPERLPAGLYACGKVAGAYDLAARMADGERAGRQAVSALGSMDALPVAPLMPVRECPNHPYPVFAHLAGKEFVDFDEDLQIKDIENACQEGFDSTELLKRYSTMGMGPSQGKHSNLNALRILAAWRGDAMGAHALTTSRPMFHPVPMAHLAGRGFMPERKTPMDADHARLGAVWMPAANWRRPEYYAVPGVSREAAITAEVHAVRNGVGLIDVGTLGKIEAHGARAGEFLDRIYTARYSNLKVGMTRYGLMLDESGVIIDDGVIARLTPDCFYFTTTTGNSATLFREFGRLATWWGIPVGLVNLTGHYAAFNLAGPQSRAVLSQLTDIDLSDAAFPYLAVREGLVAGVPCRLMRVGFVGELGYEIHLPFEFGSELWRALLQAGQGHGIRPFGVEAQRMLRLEKGHVIIGQDTDGVTNALEIDAPWAIKMDKAFFIGQRSLAVLSKQPLRQTLVGFQMPLGVTERPKECHLIIEQGRIAGRVTSVGFSPTLGRVIGLALVDPAVAHQSHLRVRMEAGVEASLEVTSHPFYDPAGARQKMEVAS